MQSRLETANHFMASLNPAGRCNLPVSDKSRVTLFPSRRSCFNARKRNALLSKLMFDNHGAVAALTIWIYSMLTGCHTKRTTNLKICFFSKHPPRYYSCCPCCKTNINTSYIAEAYLRLQQANVPLPFCGRHNARLPAAAGRLARISTI